MWRDIHFRTNTDNNSFISVKVAVDISRTIELVPGSLDPVLAEVLRLIVGGELPPLASSSLIRQGLLETHSTLASPIYAVEVLESASCICYDGLIRCDIHTLTPNLDCAAGSLARIIGSALYRSQPRLGSEQARRLDYLVLTLEEAAGHSGTCEQSLEKEVCGNHFVDVNRTRS